MLRLLRAHVRPNGSLLFSTFIDPALEGFNDRDPGTPLHFAMYGLTTMLKMIVDAGWRVDSFHPRDDDGHLSNVDFFVCSLPGSYHPCRNLLVEGLVRSRRARCESLTN